jgi:hypothetical protein
MSEYSDEMVDAYLRHLLAGGEAPDLANLDPRERADLERTFTLLDAIAGIDPDLVPPFEDDAVARALGRPAAAAGSDADVADTRQRVAAEIERLRRGAAVVPDEEAARLAGSRSDLLVRVGGARIRVAIVGPGELARPEGLLREADRLFYRFPETAAVALVAADDDLTSQIVEPQDCRPGVETPTGMRAGPRLRRPRLGLGAALASYLDEIEPVWEEPESIVEAADRDFDVELVAAETAAAVVRRLKDEALRARIPAKGIAFAALGDREVDELTRLVVDVARGRVGGEDVGERIGRLARDAA